MKLISDILKFHDDLDGYFRQHQIALLHFEFGAALDRLLEYEKNLRMHMRDEEEILLPIYAERAEIPRSGGVKLFLDEHEKMLAHVELFKEQTKKLISEDSPDDGLILLLDRESFYKRLTSHHDNREHDILFPMLDQITTDEEKADILNRISAKPRAFAAANPSG
jgi:iron-sulfur cluster repair protein YtfE (RIC family)